MSVRELEPRGCRLELLEQVGERHPDDHAGRGHDLQVDYKVSGGKRAEQEVEEVAGEAKRLGRRLWEHDVIVSRNGATHSEHRGLDISVLEGKKYCDNKL